MNEFIELSNYDWLISEQQGTSSSWLMDLVTKAEPFVLSTQPVLKPCFFSDCISEERIPIFYESSHQFGPENLHVSLSAPLKIIDANDSQREREGSVKWCFTTTGSRSSPVRTVCSKRTYSRFRGKEDSPGSRL